MWAHGLSPFSQETTLGRDMTNLTILYTVYCINVFLVLKMRDIIFLRENYLKVLSSEMDPAEIRFIR
jgi:hypothetical protein